MKIFEGDIVRNKERGKGVVIGIDNSNPDYEFLIQFGKGHLCWLPEKAIKMVDSMSK